MKAARTSRPDNSVRYVIRRKSDGLYFKKTHRRTPSWVARPDQAKLYLSQITAMEVNFPTLCWQAGDYELRLPWPEHKTLLIHRFRAAYEVVPVQLTFVEIKG